LQLAIEFLEEIFESVSSISAKEIFKQAKIEAYSERTIKRAKKELGIISYKDSDEEGNNVWYWKLRSKQEDEYAKKINASLKQLNLPKMPKF